MKTEHIEKFRSVWDIASGIGLHHTREIIKKLKEFKLPFLKHNNNEGRSLARVEKAKKTSLEKYGYEFHLTKGSKIRKKLENNVLKKYGVSNVGQIDSVKTKIKKTMLNRYGVTCMFKTEKCIKKVKETYLRKYGVDNIFKSKEMVEKFRISKAKKGIFPTSKQAMKLFNFIFYYLISNGFSKKDIYCLPCTKEFGKRLKNRYCFYDFVIPKLKFCVEYNGNYYHANPRMYKSEDIIYHGKKASDVWKTDNEKINFLRNKGYDVWIIWEFDYQTAADYYDSKIIKHIFNPELKDKNFESNFQKDLI